MSKLAKWLWIIVCQWLLSFAVFGLLVLSLWNVVDYWRSANWSQVDGKITSLKISNYDGSEADQPWFGNGKLLCLYAYTFKGQPCSGNRIGVETFDDAKKRARRYRELKAKLDEAKPVTVWVNPAAPEESALFREATSEMYYGPVLGLLWFSQFLWRYIRKKRKHASGT